MILAKYRTYSIYAGGESCIDGGEDLDRLLIRWNKTADMNLFMQRTTSDTAIHDAVRQSPQKGQMLIGRFDPGQCFDVFVRRNPRGYMLMWEEVEVTDVC